MCHLFSSVQGFGPQRNFLGYKATGKPGPSLRLYGTGPPQVCISAESACQDSRLRFLVTAPRALFPGAGREFGGADQEAAGQPREDLRNDWGRGLGKGGGLRDVAQAGPDLLSAANKAAALAPPAAIPKPHGGRALFAHVFAVMRPVKREP